MEKVYTKSIRNVALLGHSGGGKTSLAESMLYISRLTDRLGNVADGDILYPQPQLLCFGTELR